MGPMNQACVETKASVSERLTQIEASLNSCHGFSETIADRLAGSTPKQEPCTTDEASDGIEGHITRISNRLSALQGDLERICQRL